VGTPGQVNYFFISIPFRADRLFVFFFFFFFFFFLLKPASRTRMVLHASPLPFFLSQAQGRKNLQRQPSEPLQGLFSMSMVKKRCGVRFDTYALVLFRKEMCSSFASHSAPDKFFFLRQFFAPPPPRLGQKVFPGARFPPAMDPPALWAVCPKP